MNITSHRFMIKCLLFGIALLTLGIQISYAQSKTELELLQMYYRETELVDSPTRHPKQINHVAENIEIVTSEEIEAINAHTVAEILKLVPGIFVNFNQDYGSTSLISTQGSEQYHVLVLFDGVPWNSLGTSSAETNSIPVGIIDRIEIIKGPASSSWGSALGGVINIIPKSAAISKEPSGYLKTSIGERSSWDTNQEISGQTETVDYLVYSGVQHSDGLGGDRAFENYSLYAKASTALTKKIKFEISSTYSRPDIKLGDYTSRDFTSTALMPSGFTKANLSFKMADSANLNASLYDVRHKSSILNHSLGLSYNDNPGDVYLDTIYDENILGGSVVFSYDRGIQTLVAGFDFQDGQMEQIIKSGSLLQMLGAQPIDISHPKMNSWAFYINDTIEYSQWSFTPGIRYDYDSISGFFISPSVGLTYQINDTSLLRGSISRGFSSPPLTWTQGGS